MNPPRWSTPYSDDVRDALTRMVEGERASAQPAPADRRRSRIRLAVAIVIALLLVVPASITALVLAEHAGPAGGGTTLTVPTPTPTAVRPASAGCAPTSAGIPAGADTGVIDDVDGDHRPDTEWAVLDGGTIVFGITTDSGATASARAEFAGGGDRTSVVGHLANGAVVAIPSEGRDSELWSFSGCAFHRVQGTNPDLPTLGGSFTLSSKSGGGDAVCLDGELYSVSYATDGGGLENVVGQRVRVSSDRSTATLSSAKRTIASRLDPTALARYQGVSCGTAPVLRPKQGS